MTRGRLIVIEGPDKVGKSTQVTRLEQALHARGLDVVASCDPGGEPAANELRRIIKTNDLTPWAEVLVFTAARAQLVEQVLRPALARGAVVILDRYLPSTLVYQGSTVGEDAILALDALTTNPVADLVLVLDRPEPLGLDVEDRFEDGGLPAWIELRDRYRHLAEIWGWELVAAEGPTEAVTERLLGRIDALLVGDELVVPRHVT